MSSKSLSRRSALLALASAGALTACGQTATKSEKSALSDLKGRPVKPLAQGGKLSIDDGRYLIALALIHPDPVSLLAAWGGDVNRISPDMFAAFTEKWPALKALPKIPRSGEPFNLEAVLAAKPALAVVSMDSGPSDEQAGQLEAAGVPAAFIDFFNHPFQNQARSLALLGALIGRSEQAAAFNSFKKARLDAIAAKVATVPQERRPTVFLEPHAMITPDCCNSPGKGNVGDYIDFVGGRNIGADVLKAPSGKLNLEYVIQRDPDVYIATGGPHLKKAGGFVVGPDFTPEQSQAGLSRVAGRRGISTLKAVREGRAHGLSHQLINSPIDVVAVEVMAKWIHPDLFGDLNPRATLDEINTRFLAVPYRGDYWADLKSA
ncbi:ABC transporter substrate-binding protein [Caulobacter sp. RHG1]|uniref:ABC transporter substrate-binding protein n=1 Tax=Caulobacter sp. (strain RHG1) TaxID=2545762 RepID=UPI0015580F8F|nr:ABC transporter substrate-binding protein [Caulobacter sp. RHG1]NQE62653.1 ABC transporter, substrate-binding protein (cluster 8, B12/iron complex) [Caulobacter sp. RHG1]